MLSEVRDNARMLERGTIARELVPKWLPLRLRLAFLDLLPVLRAAAFSAGAGCC